MHARFVRFEQLNYTHVCSSATAASLCGVVALYSIETTAEQLLVALECAGVVQFCSMLCNVQFKMRQSERQRSETFTFSGLAARVISPAMFGHSPTRVSCVKCVCVYSERIGLGMHVRALCFMLHKSARVLNAGRLNARGLTSKRAPMLRMVNRCGPPITRWRDDAQCQMSGKHECTQASVCVHWKPVYAIARCCVRARWVVIISNLLTLTAGGSISVSNLTTTYFNQ